MAMLNFYFTSCALLLTLTWHTSTGAPMPTLSPDRCKNCSLLFRDLLLNVTQLLENKNFCYGILSEKAVVKSNAETVLACAPTLTENSGCMNQRTSPFSETECLRSIMKDLAFHAAAFRSYLNFRLRSRGEEVALLSPTLEKIESLRENCSLMPNEDSDSSEEETSQMWGDDSFSNRQEMCEMMRGFQARTITINRAMGYISSGGHRK